MGTPVVSEEVRAYFAGLLKQVQDTYAIARAARTRGFDPELDVEIPLTDDLASRVERLLENYEVDGVATRDEQRESGGAGRAGGPRHLDRRDSRRAARRARRGEDQAEPRRLVVRRPVLRRSDPLGRRDRTGPERPHRGHRAARARPRTVHSHTGRGRAIQGGDPVVPPGPTSPVHAVRRGNLVDRVELSRGDRRRRNGGRGDQRAS